MAKATSSHFKPALSGAEEHNERTKRLDYVRKDLSHLNQTWKADGFTTVDQARKDVAEKYKAAHGKKLPKNATPIQETVVVIKSDTTMQQLQLLAKRIEETWGFKPLAIYTHMDEGHKSKSETREWKPNLHAHIVFDTTDSKGETLKPISEKMRKSQQSKWEKKEAELALKENREPRKFFAPDSWSKPAFDYMQDLTAECLEMERGVSSSAKHKDALEYKVSVLTEQAEAEAEKLHQIQEQNRLDSEELKNRCENLRAEGEYAVKAFDFLKELEIVMPTKEQKDFRDKMENECKRPMPTDHRELTNHALKLYCYLTNLVAALQGIAKKMKEIAKSVPLLAWRKHWISREATMQGRTEAAERRAANSIAEAEKARKSAENAEKRANEQESKVDERIRAVEDEKNKIKQDYEIKECILDIRAEQLDMREKKIEEREENIDQEIASAEFAAWNQVAGRNTEIHNENDALKTSLEEKNTALKNIAKFVHRHFDSSVVQQLEASELPEYIGKDTWNEAKEAVRPKREGVTTGNDIRHGWGR